jgi:alpha-tubulin suppressor-like RCC1 family protein
MSFRRLCLGIALVLPACDAPIDQAVAPSVSEIVGARLPTSHRLGLGNHHGCLAKPDGNLNCWGNNTSGELGVAPSFGLAIGLPMLVPFHNAAQVAAGDALTCVLDLAGDIWCFGDSSGGALGRGGFPVLWSAPNPTPVKIAATGPFTRVIAGSRHACGLKDDGTLLCWGANGYGQLGPNGPRKGAGTPVVVGGPYVDAVAGAFHTCALRADRRVECFGRGDLGEVGDGTGASSRVPRLVVDQSGSALDEVVAISSGYAHACALRSNGDTLCWGSGDLGQLGDGNLSPHLALSALPTRVGHAVSALGTGGTAFHSCVLSAIGIASCFGDDTNSKLGSGSSGSPGPVAFALDAYFAAHPQIAEITTGGDQTCALMASGELACAGVDNGWNYNTNSPQQTISRVGTLLLTYPVSMFDLKSISSGWDHSCGVRIDGSVSCWGNNAYSELGTYGVMSSPSAVGVFLPMSAVARDVATGLNFSCTALTDGTVACWGKNNVGQTGMYPSLSMPWPSRVPGVAGALSIAAGERHACALTEGGTAWCWGDNSLGQLGNGSLQASNAPTVVALGGITKLVTGALHACAIAAGGSVVCWGDNGGGQLGSGVAGPPSGSPTTVAGLPPALDLAAGFMHSCALVQGGDVWCWGSNAAGQLGDGTRNPHFAPVRVAGGATALAAGGNHSCSISGSGALSCWGENADYELSGSQGTDITSPTPVLSSINVITVALGAHHLVALGSDQGPSWVQGANNLGQLGVGTTSPNQPVPARGP